jgi:hypothetical protein
LPVRPTRIGIVNYPCPFCGALASGETGCPACGRGPERLAIEVVRLDGVIADLTTRLNATRLAAQRLEGELKQAWVRRAAAAAEVRDVVAQTRIGPVSDPSPSAVEPRHDASTRWIQNTLFLLGGLLLAVAAIVFTAVAWAQFGVGGRAALLGAFTLAALAVPPVAVRRGLAATAETFAAVGLLLVLLDGYAAWYVDLFAVTRFSPWVYAALVCTVTAAVALALSRLSGPRPAGPRPAGPRLAGPRLAGPRLAALLIAQPVLPLLTVPAHPSVAGYAYTFAGVLALNLTVLVLTGHTLRIVAGALAGAAALPVGAFAVIALLDARDLGRTAVAGAALTLTAILPLTSLFVLGRRLPPESSAAVTSPGVSPAAARPASVHGTGGLPRGVPSPVPVVPTSPATVVRAARAFFAGLLVVEAAAVAVRAALLVAPEYPLLADSLALFAVAALAVTVRSVWLDGIVARGVQIGAAVAVAPFALAATAAGAQNALLTLETARPLLAASPAATVPGEDPRLPLTLAILAAAIALTVPAAGRRLTVLSAGGLVLLAVPAALHLPWWTAPIFDLTGVAAALLPATRYTAALLPPTRDAAPLPPPTRDAAPLLPPTRDAAPLLPATRDAVADAGVPPRTAPQPVTSAFVYGSQVAVALGLALHGVTAAFGTPAVAAATLTALSALAAGLAFRTRRGPRRLDLAGPGVLVSLVSLPAIAWTTTAALASSEPAQSRVALAAALLPALAYHLTTRRMGDLRPFALAAALIPLAVVSLWAAPAGDSTAIYAAVALLALAGLSTARSSGLAALLPGAAFLIATAEPLARILDSRHTPHVAASTPIAFLILTTAATVTIRRMPRSRWTTAATTTLPLLASTATLALAAARVPWPYLPAAELLFGLAGLLAVARRATVSLGVVSALLAGAGLAALGHSHPAAVGAAGAVLIAAAVAGVAGRTLKARLTGWLAAVAAAVGVLRNVVEIVDRDLAYPLLGLAAATLALSWALHRAGRAIESRAVEAAAHAAAVFSLLLALDAPYTVCFVWGAALAVRALRRDHRDRYLITAAAVELAGWCQLMAADHVGLVEAYSIPAAAVALLAGLRARRRTARAALSSWAAYGPALSAALLPSLASIAGSDGHYPRRLILGLAALAILLAGARARLQAPVVLGGSALALVALHELAQVWDLVPRWIPLAAAGLLLVVLAATLERRRRDFARLRTAFTHMT